MKYWKKNRNSGKENRKSKKKYAVQKIYIINNIYIVKKNICLKKKWWKQNSENLWKKDIHRGKQ